MQLFCIFFLGTNRVTFVLLLDLVALERTRLVGITVGLGLKFSRSPFKCHFIEVIPLLTVNNFRNTPPPVSGIVQGDWDNFQ